MFNKPELWNEAECIISNTLLEQVSPFKGALLSLMSLPVYSARYDAQSNMGHVERLGFFLFLEHSRCNVIKDPHSLVTCLREK